jgi:glucose/mannose-6-phosphate isomerase
MNVDKSNMIKTLRTFPDMVKKASSLGDDITFPKQLVENIIVLGMGGSGFTGDLLKVYLHDVPIQIHVVKDYVLPNFVSRKSLVFAISYSGNTEETISAYRFAVRRGCKIISISSGGKLEQLAKMNKNPYIKIPGGIQPRLSVPYLFIPILNTLNYSGIIDEQENIIKKCIKDLKAVSEKIEASGKELASKVKGKIPIIYSSQKLFALAEKWKTDINENAKTHVFYNVFSEFNHNEICGYQNPNGNFHVIIINDTRDHQKIKDRIKVFKKLMKKYDVEITELGITGNNFLTRLLSTIWMGHFFAYYLALEYDTDPTPVEIIEKFKKELK